MRFKGFLWVLVCASVQGIQRELLYNFEVPEAQRLPKEDDVSSDEIQLQVPVVFYGVSYKTIFVNSNGFLSFQTEIPQFINMQFPLDYAIIAPFYSNVDTTESGTISYFETQDPALLRRASESVHDSFLDAAEFEAKSLFIVTWDSVGYFNRRADKVNTYQVVLMSDGQATYAAFNYPEQGLQWIQGTGDESGLPDARAQVGFSSTDGRLLTLPGSATEQVQLLEKWSNVNLPGEFIHKISDRDIQKPDAYEQTYSATCAETPTPCHSRGTCFDYPEGFCCECTAKHIGNGKFCVADGQPLRATGKVNGKLNGERLENLDLQSYIVTADGRAYTAISKVPESIGGDIQTLQVLGSVLAYLFAKPVRGAVNGFQLTGGYLNHTSIITFLNTSQTVHVNQRFLGLDVFDQIKVEMDVQGDIPNLPHDSRLIIDEYQEQYTQTSPDLIQMSAERAYIYNDHNGNEITNFFRIDQAFQFDICPFKNHSQGNSWTLKVGRNFISYESREQIIRFGINNKVTPIGEYDPCIEGRQSCGPDSSCVIEGSSFSCVCNPGYQRIYAGQEQTCVDINECQSNHDCDRNAQCYNDIGSYQCICNPGYEGNGRSCRSVASCANVTCSENSECVESEGDASCRCLPGFRGDGYYCQAVQSQTCDVANNCSPYGICSIDPTTNLYSCSCHPGFEGDGYTCVNVPTTTPAQDLTVPTTTAAPTHDTGIPQRCQDEYCWCPEGYIVDRNSNNCIPTNYTPPSASIYGADCSQQCDVNARCIFYETLPGHVCTCNEGYEGDGYTCQEERQSCMEDEECGHRATCVYNETIGKSRCACDPGFVGDGYTCLAAVCSSDNDCAHNEECIYGHDRYECGCKEGHIRDSQLTCVPDGGYCGGGVCVDNAECVYDEDEQINYCACKEGFVGDGITQCRERPVGCDTLNNCGLHATCQYEEPSLTYVCRCNAGFFGDGFVCHAERNCLVDSTMCHSNAYCTTDANRKYICQCKPGFIGDGQMCKEISKTEGNFLLLNQGWATHKIPMEASRTNPGKPIQFKLYQTAVGLDIDCMEGRVYWSDINLHAIRSSLFNGTDNQDFITKDVYSPEGLAVDWVSRNIYWTDSTSDTIEVANIDSKRRRTLFRTGLVNPRGIAVHPQRGKIFWTDWDRTHPKIEWANADGTDRKIFLEGLAVSLPNSLAIDYDTEQLCYSDAGTHKIECVYIDNKQIQTIAVNCTYPFGITVTDKMVYWSDWLSKKIERVDKYSLNRLTPLNVPPGGSGNKLFGLVAVPSRCPQLTNICQYSRCQEEHICLPDGKGSKSCSCSKKIDSDEEPRCVI